MALSLEQLQAAFKKNDNNNNEGGRPNNYFPFWDMKDNEKAVVRFLPDANEDNPMGFLVEKLMHNLTINGETKRVPCLKMYGHDDCPICAVSRAYYKEEGKKSPNGKKYWRKKQHIAQALIVSDPLPADKETGETYEGKIRFLNLGWQVYEKIKADFESGELDTNPVEFKNGCNFNIGKSPSADGDYSTYAMNSGFARKSTDLTEDEIALVTDEMVDLSTLLPPEPTREKVEAMLNAALTGGEYEEGGSAASSSGNTPAATPTPAKAEEAPAAAPASEEADDDAAAADDILAKIRARRAESE